MAKQEQIYDIQGFDEAGHPTVGCKTTVIKPGTPDKDVKDYLRGPYWNFISTGLDIAADAHNAQHSDFVKRVKATAYFTIQPAKPWNEELREIREAKGWTQVKMAEELAITREHYISLETGRNRITHRTMRLARAL